MVKLIEYILNREKSLKYINWNFENANALCQSVMECTPFEKGDFSTFLREGLGEEELSQLRRGHVGGGVKERITEWLLEENQQKDELLTIFDLDDADYKEEKTGGLFSKLGVHFDNEVYYLLSNEDVTKHNIRDCLYESDIIWHSLCIVSKYPYKRNKDQSITKEELEQIAKNAMIILVLAYDGEGYIIWKRNL
jgi:hypothetical protein